MLNARHGKGQSMAYASSCPSWEKVRWKLSVSLCLGLFCFSGCSAKYKPADIKSLTVYGVQATKASGMSTEELASRKHVTVDESVVRQMFKDCTWHSSFAPVWKGDDLGIVKLEDGTELRLRISMYGAFFEISGQRGWYDAEGTSSEKVFKDTMREIEKKLNDNYFPENQ
jgi:hypothetical protein